MCSRFLLVTLVIVLYVKDCQSQSACTGTTCGECISSGYSCYWCVQKNFTAPRCQPRGSLLAAGCDENNIEDPKASLTFLQSKPVQDSSSDANPAVQIQPQRIRIVTRPRMEHTISMVFRAANNFPVDLYFLFDNSLSMKTHIESLAKLANDIGQSIGDISSNYLMGYGVFQDKVILPFTDTSPKKLINPCVSNKNPLSTCDAPFEFKHLLNMTKDIDKFKDQVSKTGVTGNIDHPEGSFDAILQAVQCQSEIGWRAVGRKLLIFASNDRFHLAGDGRLAGIVIPNDGECHLDRAGLYAKALEQDYPSVGQLTDIVTKKQVHIIFAVSNDQIRLFEQLSRRIPQSIVEILASPDDPANPNIKEIIEKKYKEMISEVEIVYDKVEGVDVQIKARSDTCQTLGTNKCKGLEIGEPVRFDVEVKVTQCPADPRDRKKTVTIYPTSLKSDQMVLEIETICECSCANDPSTWEPNSDICSEGNGTLKCGQCDCHEGHFGQFCECDATMLDTSKSGCISPSENTTTECNGAGVCECGRCKCDDGYSGSYCECNDRACGSFRREVCGGVRGRCVCGECICEEGYTGNTCECATSNLTCHFNRTICSDAGTCECGECQCKKGYIGEFCQNCFLCGDTACEIPKYRDCAECAISEEKDDCPEDCPEIKLVDSLKSEVDEEDSKECSVKQADGCFLKFRTVTSDTNVTLIVQKTTTCPEPVNILPIALGVVGGVVAIGLLLLLLWKILTSILDRVEYSRFQEDLKKCKWAQQDNPFYKGATTTYKNPMLDTSEPIDNK